MISFHSNVRQIPFSSFGVVAAYGQLKCPAGGSATAASCAAAVRATGVAGRAPVDREVAGLGEELVEPEDRAVAHVPGERSRRVLARRSARDVDLRRQAHLDM